MKKIFFIILSVFSLSILNVYAEETVTDTIENIEVQETKEEDKNYLVSINDTKYETLEEALKVATKDDVITLLDDITLSNLIIDKEININANNKTLNLGYLQITGNLKLTNATLLINPNSTYSIMMNNEKAVFSLINSKANITNRGMYSSFGATINLDNSNLTIQDINYVAWMQGDASYKYANLNVTNNSTFKISNVKRTVDGGGNGLNWINTTVSNSKLIIENCEYQAIVGGSLILKDNSSAIITNNSYAHTMYRSDEINVDGTSNLTITKSRATGIWVWGGKITFQKGSNVNLTDNGNSTENEPDNMDNIRTSLSSSVIYLTTKGKTELNIEDGANVNITNNYMRAITNNGIAYIGNTTNITNNGLVNPNYEKNTVSYGGGIFNAGSLTISDANIYNNHALLAADDIYNLEGSTISFKDTKEDWILDDCNDKINAWYDDSENNRWNAHTEKEDELHIDKVSSGKKDNNLTIKAAHNLKAKVIAHYVDQDGNTISKDEILNGYVDDTYKTIQKEIEGYEFLEVQGNEEGKYTIKDIEVTYIYEYVHGEGDGEDPKEEKPYTGAYESINILPIVSLTLSLGVILNRKNILKEN